MNTSIVNNVLLATKPLGERLGDGLQVFVIGIAAVFAVLAVLWGVLALFKIFFYDLPEKKKAKAKAARDDAKNHSNELVPVVVGAENAAENDNDEQLIAVITAAIAAYNADAGKNALPFRVVSYKRVKGSGGWNSALENESF